MDGVLKPCYKCNGNDNDCDVCQGDGEIFYTGGEEERFNLLADRWEEETFNLSWIEMHHPCFVQLNKMKSKEAIVWVLNRMKKEKSWILILLTMWVNKATHPTSEDMAGKLEDLTEAWLEWGYEKKLIKSEK